MNEPGRRTGIVINKSVPVDRHGFEDIDAFWDSFSAGKAVEESPQRLFTEGTTPLSSPIKQEVPQSPSVAVDANPIKIERVTQIHPRLPPDPVPRSPGDGMTPLISAIKSQPKPVPPSPARPLGTPVTPLAVKTPKPSGPPPSILRTPRARAPPETPPIYVMRPTAPTPQAFRRAPMPERDPPRPPEERPFYETPKPKRIRPDFLSVEESLPLEEPPRMSLAEIKVDFEAPKRLSSVKDEVRFGESYTYKAKRMFQESPKEDKEEVEVRIEEEERPSRRFRIDFDPELPQAEAFRFRPHSGGSSVGVSPSKRLIEESSSDDDVDVVRPRETSFPTLGAPRVVEARVRPKAPPLPSERERAGGAPMKGDFESLELGEGGIEPEGEFISVEREDSFAPNASGVGDGERRKRVSFARESSGRGGSDSRKSFFGSGAVRGGSSSSKHSREEDEAHQSHGGRDSFFSEAPERPFSFTKREDEALLREGELPLPKRKKEASSRFKQKETESDDSLEEEWKGKPSPKKVTSHFKHRETKPETTKERPLPFTKKEVSSHFKPEETESDDLSEEEEPKKEVTSHSKPEAFPKRKRQFSFTRKEDEVTSPFKPGDVVTERRPFSFAKKETSSHFKPEETESDDLNEEEEPRKRKEEVTSPFKPGDVVTERRPFSFTKKEEITSPFKPEEEPRKDKVTSPFKHNEEEPSKKKEGITSPFKSNDRALKEEVTSPFQPSNRKEEVNSPFKPSKKKEEVTSPFKPEEEPSKRKEEVTSPFKPEEEPSKRKEEITSPFKPEEEPSKRKEEVTSPFKPEEEPSKRKEEVTSPFKSNERALKEEITSPFKPEEEPSKRKEEVTSPFQPSKKRKEEITSPFKSNEGALKDQSSSPSKPFDVPSARMDPFKPSEDRAPPDLPKGGSERLETPQLPADDIPVLRSPASVVSKDSDSEDLPFDDDFPGDSVDSPSSGTRKPFSFGSDSPPRPLPPRISQSSPNTIVDRPLSTPSKPPPPPPPTSSAPTPRRSPRERTKPVKHYKGEKIIYALTENGCMTKVGVQKGDRSEEKPRRPRRKAPVRRFTVLPKRDVEEKVEKSRYIRFPGIEDPKIATREFHIRPRHKAEYTPKRKGLVIIVSGGTGRLTIGDEDWDLSEGGIVHLVKGVTSLIKNTSEDSILDLYVTTFD